MATVRIKKIVGRKTWDCEKNGPIPMDVISRQSKPVFCKLDVYGPVKVRKTAKTEINDMFDAQLAVIVKRFEIQEYNIELAALVATIDSRNFGSSDTSIYYWSDRFWMLVVDSIGVSYYHNKQSALYEVQVESPDVLLSFF